MTARTAAVLDILSAPVATGRRKSDNPRLELALLRCSLVR